MYTCAYMYDELVSVVDKEDKVITDKLRSVLTNQDRWRIASLLIYDDHANVLIAQRSANKELAPLKWEFSVTGTLLAGESYEEAVKREAQEEIQFTPKSIIKLGSFEYASEKGRRWLTVFCAHYNGQTSFTLQKSEVEQSKWVSINELERWIRDRPSDFVTAAKFLRPLLGKIPIK